MNRQKKQNLSVGIIAGVGVILIIGGILIFSLGFRFSKYKNNKEGYSIKYPSNWSIDKNEKDATVIFLSPKDNELDIFRENVSVIVQNISNNPLDLNSYSKLAIKQMTAVFEDNLVILDSGQVRFAKSKGFRFEFIGMGKQDDMHFLIYWTIRGLKAYQVTYTALNPYYKDHLLKVKMMINSFKIN